MTKPEKNGGLRRWFFGLLMLFGFGLLSYTIYRITGEAYRQREIDQEIASLQSEIDRLNKKNKDLKEMIDYFQTEPFKEKELKDKLDMIKDGEELVYVKEKEVTANNEDEESKKPIIIVEKPHYYFWWKFFFESR